jgi:hypothetical protein
MPSPQLPFLLPFSDFIESPLHDLNVAQEAVDRLVQQYKTPNTQALIRALCAPAQDLEDALIQVYVGRWINTAVGAQLDVLGKIVGQPRGGFADDFYRLTIQVRVLINRSSGGPEELYTILGLVVPMGATLALAYFQPAAFNMTISGVGLSYPLGLLFAGFINEARAAGVGGWTIWSDFAPSATFTFDGSSGQGFDQGALANASP